MYLTFCLLNWLMCCFFVSNHKSTTSRQPRRVKFNLQAYFNPTKRILTKKVGSPPPPHPHFNRVNDCINLPLLGNPGGWNSTCKLILTQIKEIWKKWAHHPTPASNRVNDCNLGSRQPRRLKFDMQVYFNPTKRNLFKKLGSINPK